MTLNYMTKQVNLGLIISALQGSEPPEYATMVEHNRWRSVVNEFEQKLRKALPGFDWAQFRADLYQE